ncbi:hypothetical protein SUGI_0201860 [Cryptomeria japonica]|nr:hypothetical protein SUGI_0201860 [Cryptomeria japonica]
MSLSSDSETELDKQPENGAEYQYEINKQMMNDTDVMVNNEPKVRMGNESKIFLQNEPEIGNCSHDISFKSKAKRKNSYHCIKQRENWGWREEIAIVSAVRDCVNCHFDGVKSATSALTFSKYTRFWTEVQKKFNAETGNCICSECVNRTFNALRIRYYYYHRRINRKQLNPYEVELFGILKELFGNGKKRRSEICRTAKKSSANENEGLCVKRAKWSGIDEILFASVVRDGLSHGLNDMNSGKNVTCFKTHREFWDEVTKTLREKTGKSASPFQVLQKFRNLRAKLMTKKQNKTLSQHDEHVLGLLEQVYSYNGVPKMGIYESPISDAKEVSIDHKMSTEKKSLQSTCMPHDPDLFCGYELRDRNKTMKVMLKPNTKSSFEKSPRQGSNRICLRSGGNEGGMQLRARFSAVKPLAKHAKQPKKQNSDLSCDKEENYKANYKADSLPAFSCNKRIKRGVKEGLEPKDEISIANAVRDGMNCGIGGLKSARDAMSFRTHEGFWIEMNRKFNEETGKCTSAYELFQAFRSSKYKYLNSKRSLIHELSQHDEELFSILEEVFSKDKKHGIGLSGTQLFDANSKLSWAPPSGNQVEKLYRQNGASTEQSPEHRNDVNQDNQTFKDLSSHLLVSAEKEEGSSPNFLKTANPLPMISPGDVLCQNGTREATFLASVKHGVENPDAMMDTRSVKDKFRRPNEQAEIRLECRNAINQDNQTHKELPCQVPLSSDGSTGVETQHQKEEQSHLNVLNAFDLPLPLASFRDPLHCGKTKATFSDPLKHGVKNLDVLKETENIGGGCKMLDDGAHTMLNEIVEECMQDPQNMTFMSEGKNKQSNREQLVTGCSLNGNKVLEDVSCHGNGYTEIVKRLEWKSRKLQLMQELYKIEQLEVEDRIRQAKLKASPGNP